MLSAYCIASAGAGGALFLPALPPHWRHAGGWAGCGLILHAITIADFVHYCVMMPCMGLMLRFATSYILIHSSSTPPRLQMVDQGEQDDKIIGELL